ncbi:hypothetical protein P389DRAFT_169808, partial [Cystobasidium minutum MCA 4210]|uniref:uncharacterized protein n=1 Tax=Cystobasidium minutum MCA 4210 TaxID=1397322 RepID=UPI0034CF8EF3|eukprot:jgi/Rhomi1/169808/fgenesh1_kg.3_\
MAAITVYSTTSWDLSNTSSVLQLGGIPVLQTICNACMTACKSMPARHGKMIRPK